METWSVTQQWNVKWFYREYEQQLVYKELPPSWEEMGQSISERKRSLVEGGWESDRVLGGWGRLTTRQRVLVQTCLIVGKLDLLILVCKLSINSTSFLLQMFNFYLIQVLQLVFQSILVACKNILVDKIFYRIIVLMDSVIVINNFYWQLF